MNAASIFTDGMACMSLAVADRLGILNTLQSRMLSESELNDTERFPHSVSVQGALDVLCYAGIVEHQGGNYQLTMLGRDVVENIGAFQLWFQGYAKLLLKQVGIAAGTETFSPDDVAGDVVAQASFQIGERYVDPILIEVLKELSPSGVMTDLGCGNGRRLVKLCRQFQVNGLGVDLSPAAVEVSRAYTKRESEADPQVEVVCADVTRLEGVWPEVDLVMQTFMTHHIVPDDHCVEILRSYQDHFPNARYFLILDTVTSNETNLHPQLFAPGFDYIHRLENLTPRTQEAALEVFREAGYKLYKEVKLGVPNSFAWVLERAR